MKIVNGYIHIKVNNIFCPEHRLVVERFIGRTLTTEEVIHHINWNKQDNRISNLFLFPTKNKMPLLNSYLYVKVNHPIKTDL